MNNKVEEWMAYFRLLPSYKQKRRLKELLAFPAENPDWPYKVEALRLIINVNDQSRN